MSQLLDQGFVHELEVLRRRLQIRARSGGAGDHVARRRGGSAEFEEHRSYAPGDDMRRIDWLAYARSGEPYVKVFRAEEDVVARLLIDSSASLGFGEPSKFEIARRIAAAVGYMALAESERAQLVVTRDSVTRDHLPARGRGGLPTLLRDLDALTVGGGTDIGHGIDTILRKCRRPGLLMVVSDFFDAAPLLTKLTHAASAGHDVVLVQVLAPEDEHPAHEGDLTLEDAETGELVELTLDESAINAYRARLEGLFAALRSWARKHRASYVRTSSDLPIGDVVRRVVVRAVD
jgi:uncharacterized protein (DUF58 family)